MNQISNQKAFSGDPTTIWESDNVAGDRIMQLVGDFTYTDPDGVSWTAPDGAWLNGASIPRCLWSYVGSPYTGDYRLAAIVHDYFVGEGDNPDVTPDERKKADRMFYFACIDGGCSKDFAAILYIAVRFGSWMSGLEGPFRGTKDDTSVEYLMENPEDEYARSLFWDIVRKSKDAIENADLDGIDRSLKDRLWKFE